MGFFDDMKKRLTRKPEPEKKEIKETKPKQTKPRRRKEPRAIPEEEITEKKIISIVWSCEVGGVKRYMFGAILGRHRIREAMMIVNSLLRRNILIRDQYAWIHINPYHIEEILRKYDIPFDEEETKPIRKAILRRIKKEKRQQITEIEI